jgi:hypothetical protein
MLDAAAMPGRRSESGNLFLTLDGVKCGPVRSAEGGFVTADVVVSKPAAGKFASKHITGVRYEPFVVAVGFSNAAPVYDWVADTWKNKIEAKSGSLVLADYKLEAKREREFLNALLTEASFPTLDAASKEQGFLTLKFRAELVKEKTASGKQDAAAAKAKQWLRSGFRLQIDGLDCTKVTKIESLSVTSKVAEDQLGQTKESALEPTTVDFPNLEITLNEVSSKTWSDWLEDFVIKGKNSESDERSGTIQLLAADAKTELARIKLIGLGIYQLETLSTEKISSVKAELYCKRMELVVKP